MQDLLGVSRTATRREILDAYAALPAELASSLAAQLCRDTFGDPARRAQYDAQLNASERELRRIELRSRLAWSVVMIGAGLTVGGLWTM